MNNQGIVADIGDKLCKHKLLKKNNHDIVVATGDKPGKHRPCEDE